MTTVLGAPPRPEPQRNRWAAPAGILLGVSALGVALALTFGRFTRIAEPSPEPATPEPAALAPLLAPRSPEVAAPQPDPTGPTPASAVTIGAPAATDQEATPPPEAPLRPLPPI